MFVLALARLGHRAARGTRVVRWLHVEVNMVSGVELDRSTAVRVFGAGYFNLIRRGADGSLSISMDHWRLEEATADAFRFAAREDNVPPLEVAVVDVERLVWDRLPKQQVRSQIRFVFASGDLWTFSGSVDESALPAR